MIRNRSVPRSTVIPVLAYDDPNVAADWLVRAFGFRVRLRIGGHRVQMTVGDGAVIVTDGGGGGRRRPCRAGTGSRRHDPPGADGPPLRGAAVHGARSGRPPLDVLGVDR